MDPMKKAAAAIPPRIQDGSGLRGSGGTLRIWLPLNDVAFGAALIAAREAETGLPAPARALSGQQDSQKI
jgi:hypothetical protein